MTITATFSVNLTFMCVSPLALGFFVSERVLLGLSQRQSEMFFYFALLAPPECDISPPTSSDVNFLEATLQTVEDRVDLLVTDVDGGFNPDRFGIRQRACD